MQANLSELVMRFLPDDVVGNIASSMGVAPADGSAAVTAAVRGVLAGMAQKAASPEGAREIAAVLDDQDLEKLGKRVASLSDESHTDVSGAGAKLAGHLLGNAGRDKVVADVAKDAGITAEQSQSLIALLTPVVAGTLIQQQGQHNLDAAGLARLLTPESPTAVASSAPTAEASVTASMTPAVDLPTLKPALVTAPPPAAKPAPTPFQEKIAAAGAALAASNLGNTPPARGADAIPEVPKLAKRDSPAPRPRDTTLPRTRETRPNTAARTGGDDDAIRDTPRTRTQRAPRSWRRILYKPSASVEAAPVRDTGHHLARWGWLLPLALLAIAGTWWISSLYDQNEQVAMTEPPPAAAARAPAPVIAETPVRPLPVPEVPKADLPPTVIAKAPEPPPVIARMPDPPAETKRPPVVATADLDAARIAAEAASARAARDADTSRRIEAEAATARAAREADARRRADAEAAARAAADAQSRVPTPAAKVPVAGDAPAVCRKSIAETSAANRVRFEFASARITPASVPTLKQLAAVIKTCPTVRIRVEGHTDTDGHFDRNERLSANRARSVAAYLARAGVAPSRLSSVGFGQMRPRVPNTSEANKQLNRRIEFNIDAS